MLKAYLLVSLFIIIYTGCFGQEIDRAPSKAFVNNLIKVDTYLGVYHSDFSPLVVEIIEQNGVLMVQVEGKSRFPLKQIGQNCFELDNSGSELQFDSQKGRMLFKQGGREFLFERVQ